jgi:hypothetical protein
MFAIRTGGRAETAAGASAVYWMKISRTEGG